MAITKFKPFRCAECGHEVQLVKRAGRTREYRPGLALPVPDTFEIPTCPSCGEEYFTVELGEALAEVQAGYLRSVDQDRRAPGRMRPEDEVTSDNEID
jgi:NAD-dependent SIR2 family protein deacetylase